MRTPAPKPLTKEEFDRRVRMGAKTFEQIDPEFSKWFSSGIVGFFLRRKHKKLLGK